MKKQLEIQIDRIDWTNNAVSFHITNQTHRNAKFGNESAYEGDSFFRGKNLKIESSGSIDFDGKTFWVRGSTTYRDHSILIISLANFIRILEAIQEYNAFEFPDKKHKIVIDGKEIEISDESFKALKESLK